MTAGRRAATTLLGTIAGVVMLGATGCRSLPSKSTADVSARRRVYAAVLTELRSDTAASRVVLDTLIATTDIDTDLHDKVLSGLSITPRALDDFLHLQRHPVDRFDAAMLPDARWAVVSTSRLDSLRAAARAERSAGTSAARARVDAFWQQWYRAYPASGGYVVLSPASISTSDGVAVVQVRIACGPVCGETELRLLRRDAAGVWRTHGRVRLSES